METKNELDFSTKSYLFPHINKEGVRFGIIALILPVTTFALSIVAGWFHVAWAANIASALTIPLLLLAYGVFLFFRDPERYPPQNPRALLSPADGRICLIRDVPLPEELGADQSKTFQRVSVFMSVFNVHVNRMPFDAEIVKKVYVPGKFFNASLDKASKDNERCIYLMKTPDGLEFCVVQIAGLVAKRIVPFVKDGDKLKRAERFGLIRFGSRLDVYLPEGSVLKVAPGQTMVAGETILAELPEV